MAIGQFMQMRSKTWKKNDTSVDPKHDVMDSNYNNKSVAKKGYNSNRSIEWLTGWLAASLTASHSAVCLAVVSKCCPGARGPARPMLVWLAGSLASWSAGWLALAVWLSE